MTTPSRATAAAAPVSGPERIDALDGIRGVAVFGILLMNIVNDLLQSVFAIIIFYGIGFDLHGRVSLVIAVLIGCAIYAVQIVVSTLWVRRAAYGPVEWLWRQITYGRRLPLWRTTAEALLV